MDDKEPERNDHSRDEIIEMAMLTFGWPKQKCVDWYKLEIKGLNGNSPKEIVERQQTSKLIALFEKESKIRQAGF